MNPPRPALPGRRRCLSPRYLALVLLVALALPALLAPLALADHVYSHRALVVGRVVGADGMPVAGAPVEVEFHNLTVGGACFDSRDETTGPQGDFTICRHTHEMPMTGVEVTVRVLGNETRVVLDTTLRRAAVLLQLDGPTPRANQDLGGQRTFAREVLVTGRLFELEDARIENVNVTGTPLGGERVLARLETPDGALVVDGEATTDESGDYRIRLPVDEVPEGARVRVATKVGERDAPLDPALRRVDLTLVYERFSFAPDVERPGTDTPPVPAPPLALVVALVALVALLSRGRGRGGR